MVKKCNRGFMNILSNDSLIDICKILDDRSKIALVSTCKQFRKLIDKIQINTIVKCRLVGGLPFSKIFTNLLVEIIDELHSINMARNTFDDNLSLTFGNHFNQPITLPASLQSLTFGFHFNQPITLPAALQSLTFGSHFNQPVEWPAALQKLTIRAYYLYALPASVEITKI